MAFDAGITTPHSIIADVPANYSGYSPENYDEDYHGNVSVEFALSHSLNIPAVKTLNQVGLDKFINTLIEGNFKSIEKNEMILVYLLLWGMWSYIGTTYKIICKFCQ